MTPELREAIRQAAEEAAAKAPPMSDETRRRLEVLLRPVRRSA